MSTDSAAPIRILSVDDHPVLRQGVAALVKGQVRNILSKLGANDRTHAAMIGLKRRIIEIQITQKSGFGRTLLGF
jgi:DNA-binding NarL/FixJ family response regulator